MSMYLGLCVSGEPLASANAILAQAPWSGWTPAEISLDGKKHRAGAEWRREAATASESLAVESPGESDDFVVADARRVAKAFATYPRDVEPVVHLLEAIPFTLASFASVHPEWKSRTPPYHAPGFSDGHFPHGWACAFKGIGHDRLVSRRWLEYGPWRVVRGKGDLTVIQFHDLNADSATALEQARPGHERMGISDTGGFIQSSYVYSRNVDGLYEADQQTLKIVVNDREVAPREMLDAAAALKLQALGPEKPFRRLAYVFLDPALARAHLEQLWLYGLECWTIELGNEVRLDADLVLPRREAEWVRNRR